MKPKRKTERKATNMEFILASLLIFTPVTYSIFGSNSDDLTVEATNLERVLVVKGAVDDEMATKFTYKIDAISRVKKKDKQPIYVIINSPGGYVSSGLPMISAVHMARSRGFEVHCVVPVKAASMALHLLNACSHRYAFNNSMLLFHEMRIGLRGYLSPSELDQISEQMKILGEQIEADLIKNLGTTKEIFDRHNIGQTMWTGYTFNKTFPGFITIINDVKLPKEIPVFVE